MKPHEKREELRQQMSELIKKRNRILEEMNYFYRRADQRHHQANKLDTEIRGVSDELVKYLS